MKMSKFEVMATVWSDEQQKQMQIVIGEFDEYMNARIFAKAYSDYYSSTTEIIEYKRCK